MPTEQDHLDPEPAHTHSDGAPETTPTQQEGESRRAAYTYQVPLQPLYVIAAIWSVVIGLAIGIGLAAAVEATGGYWISYARIQGYTAAFSAIAVFAVIQRRYLRHNILRILFDDRQHDIIIRPPFLRGRQQITGFSDALRFELIAWPLSWRTGGALVLVTRESGTITLVVLSRPPLIESSGLPSLINRLNTHLNTLRHPTDQIDAAPGDAQNAYYQPEQRSQRQSSRQIIAVRPPTAKPKPPPEPEPAPDEDQVQDQDAAQQDDQQDDQAEIPFGLRPVLNRRKSAPTLSTQKRLPNPEMIYKRRRRKKDTRRSRTTPKDTPPDDDQQPAE